jgi:hypothetical protein
MTRLFKTLTSAGVLALLVGLLTLGFAGVAAAATPPWQTSPPAAQVGSLLFYNAAGQQITGGSTTVAPFAAYVKGTTVLNAGDATATLFVYTPTFGNPPGSWSGEQLGGTTAYPNGSAPGSLSTAKPLYTGANTDTSLATYKTLYPNSDVSNDGYAGLYEVRLISSNPTTTTTYDATDISISGTTWTVDYPTITPNPTTIALTPTPATTQTYNQSVSLSATVSPAVAGSIQFEDNGSAIGAAVTETNGTAATTTAALGVTLPLGASTLDAVFTPAANLAYSGSSTATESPIGTVSYNVTPIGTTTTITSVTPPDGPTTYAGTSETINASVVDGDSSTPSGSVQFEYQLNGSGPEQDIGSSVSVVSGAASVTTTSLPVGTDDLTAVFTPTSPDYATTTAMAVPFTVLTPPGDATNTALGVNPTSAAVDAPVQLTASVTNTTTTATPAAPVGTVTFFDNGSTNSNAITGSSIALETVNLVAGTAVVSYPISPAGTHYIVAVFNSSNLTDWADSTSAAVDFTATAQASPTPSQQNVEVDIPTGTLTITTPYSATNPFNLGTATLNAGTGTFSATAAFGSALNPSQGITITDTGIGENNWTASAEVTNFTNGGDGHNSDDISAENLTFTQVTPGYIAGNEYGTAGSNGGSIAITTNDVDNGNIVYPASALTGTEGLAGEPHSFAVSSASGTGSVYIYGNLNLIAPSSVTPGEYTATLTFTIV